MAISVSGFVNVNNLTPAAKISVSTPLGSISAGLSAQGGTLSAQPIPSFFSANNANNPEIAVAKTQQAMGQQPLYMYPPDLGSKYKMVFNFARYVRPNALSRPTFSTEFSFAFPLPKDLKEPYTINYELGDSMPLLGAVADQIQLGGQRFSDMGSYVNFMRQNADAIGKGAAVVTANELAKILGTDANLLIQQGLGAIVNPHPSVFFKGIGLRVHNFSWTFVPQSQYDSLYLKRILQNIKYRILPSYERGMAANVLDYPYMVGIQMSPDIYKFKRAVIPQILIDYAPRGTPAFYAGTFEPVAVNVSMTIQEIEYFTADNLDQDILSIDATPGTGTNLQDAIPFINKAPHL